MAEPTDLHPSLAALAAAASWEGAQLAPLPRVGLIAVRARGDAVARAAMAAGLGAMPGPNEWVACEGGYVLWLRPDEWLAAVPMAMCDPLIGALERGIGDQDGAVIDVTGSRVALELSGDGSRDVLASCVPLDLDARVFPVGRCAQTLVAKAPVLIQLTSPSPRWRLYVRPSLADYVVRWVADGMRGVQADGAMQR